MIKEGDFIEIDYTGKTVDGLIFDTTLPDVAKKAGLSPKGTYKPVVACIGQHQLLTGLDKALVGKEIGSHELTLSPEDAFGKKDAKLIQLVPLSKFKQQNVNPYPGLQLNMDGSIAYVKRVSGGRVLVDFNHPLASQSVVYDVTIKRVVEDTKEKLDAFLGLTFGPVKSELKDDVATLYVKQDVPKEVQGQFVKNFTKVIPELKDIIFKVEEQKEDAKEEFIKEESKE